MCAKFQGDRSTRLLVIAIFASVRKDEEEKKNEEKKTKLWQLVSRKWLERFSSNLVCRFPWLAGNWVANLVPIR